jgi:hypothetical protein
MKKAKTGRLQKLDKYLYKNSYFYKWGKKALKNPVGRILILAGMVVFILNVGHGFMRRHQVKQFLLEWQGHQNNQQYSEFMSAIDMSESNPYKIGFPDWKAQFFNSGMTLELREISVRKAESGLYRARALIVFRLENTIENRFRGLIFVKGDTGFKIVRVEI